MSAAPDADTLRLALDAAWWDVRTTAFYLHLSERFVFDQIRKGRLRAARCGARRGLLCCREWADSYVRERAAVVPIPPAIRRRA